MSPSPLKSEDSSGKTFEKVVEQKLFDEFINDRKLELGGTELRVNQYGTLSCLQTGRRPLIALVRVEKSGSCLVPITDVPRDGVIGIKARNIQQAFLLDALLRKDIHQVTVIGKAGTGKTLLTMAVAIFLIDAGHFDQIVVARPTVSMGKEIGFLPGSLDEKLAPWMIPIHDAIRKIEALSKGKKNLVKRNRIEFQSLGHIRGRSMDRIVLIVDEVQNLTPIEVKTVVTRAGSETKVILTGDPEQIDVPYVNALSNGLVYTERKFSGEEIAAQVRLVRGERSILTELAANKL